MDHEQAAQILPDYIEGIVGAADASALEGHLASCAECRDSVSMLRRIATELSAMGAAAFDDHPESSQLVDYTLVPAHLAQSDRERIRLHLKSCPTCAKEMASVRSAESWSRSWARDVQGVLGAILAPSRIPALATSALALLLAYPAYLGVVQLPRVASERQEAIEALAQWATKPPPQVASSKPPAWPGGPSATLALAGGTRSGGETAGSEPIPVVHLRDHQAFLPIRIDFDPSALAAEQIVVSLREINSPQQLWRHSGSAAEFWDPDDEAINLLLPADALHPGTYTLEITKEGSPAAAYSADFAIEE